MRRRISTSVLPLVVLLACETKGEPVPPPSAGEMPAGAVAAAQPRYDPSTEIDVVGRATGVRSVPHPGRSPGVHVDFEVDDQVYDLHLGPQFYLDEIGLEPAVGDQLQVVGSRRGSLPTVLIARTVTRGGKTWVLRDERGKPKWRGRGPGRGPA